MVRHFCFISFMIFGVNSSFAQNNLPYGFKIGDHFICNSDSLISLGQEFYQNAETNGEILEYQNVSFGLRINEDQQGIFSDSYPLNPLGKSVPFEIRDFRDGIRLEINDYFFASLQQVLPDKYTLTGFNLSLRPVIIHSTCEKF